MFVAISLINFDMREDRLLDISLMDVACAFFSFNFKPVTHGFGNL